MLNQRTAGGITARVPRAAEPLGVAHGLQQLLRLRHIDSTAPAIRFTQGPDVDPGTRQGRRRVRDVRRRDLADLERLL